MTTFHTYCSVFINLGYNTYIKYDDMQELIKCNQRLKGITNSEITRLDPDYVKQNDKLIEQIKSLDIFNIFTKLDQLYSSVNSSEQPQDLYLFLLKNIFSLNDIFNVKASILDLFITEKAKKDYIMNIAAEKKKEAIDKDIIQYIWKNSNKIIDDINSIMGTTKQIHNIQKNINEYNIIKELLDKVLTNRISNIDSKLSAKSKNNNQNNIFSCLHKPIEYIKSLMNLPCFTALKEIYIINILENKEIDVFSDSNIIYGIPSKLMSASNEPLMMQYGIGANVNEFNNINWETQQIELDDNLITISPKKDNTTIKINNISFFQDKDNYQDPLKGDKEKNTYKLFVKDTVVKKDEIYFNSLNYDTVIELISDIQITPKKNTKNDNNIETGDDTTVNNVNTKHNNNIETNITNTMNTRNDSTYNKIRDLIKLFAFASEIFVLSFLLILVGIIFVNLLKSNKNNTQEEKDIEQIIEIPIN